MRTILKTLSITLLLSVPVVLHADAKKLLFVQLEGAERRTAPAYPFAKTHTEDEKRILDFAAYNFLARADEHVRPYRIRYFDPNVLLIHAVARNMIFAHCQERLLTDEGCLAMLQSLEMLKLYHLQKDNMLKQFNADFAQARSEMPAEYVDADVIVGVRFKASSEGVAENAVNDSADTEDSAANSETASE